MAARPIYMDQDPFSCPDHCLSQTKKTKPQRLLENNQNSGQSVSKERRFQLTSGQIADSLKQGQGHQGSNGSKQHQNVNFSAVCKIHK